MSKPRGYLFMPNVQKQKNFGTLLRSAAAFDFHEVFMLDREKKPGGVDGDGIHGSQGTREKMAFRYFPSKADIARFCVLNAIHICGVEIVEGRSRPVHSHPFVGHTLFLLGNEATGLPQSLLRICDSFVHIDHYTDKTASLNVAVAGSIVFHHFAVWAGYSPMNFTEFKVEQVNDAGDASRAVTCEGLAGVKDPEVVRLRRIDAKSRRDADCPQQFDEEVMVPDML